MSTDADKATKRRKASRTSNAIIPDVEDSDDDLRYEPPPGAVLIKTEGTADAFDWDELRNNEDLELWVMRIPHTFRAKHLNELQIPGSSSGTLATITRKNVAYDIFDIERSPGDAENNATVGGDEILGLSCLLPRSRKDGNLFLTSKPIKRHLVLKARSQLPTPESSPATQQDSKRYEHPPERLKHRFLFTGAEVTIPLDLNLNSGDAGGLDSRDTTLGSAKEKVKVQKRKVEAGGTPRSSKKAKPSS